MNLPKLPKPPVPLSAPSVLALLFLGMATPGCSSMPNLSSAITPYRMDVRQGNYVTQEMVSQLKQGMTRDQVRYILGTPLVTDIFHANRWDYVYRFAPGRGPVQERRLTVFFQDDRLVQVTGDVVAAGGEGARAGAAAEPPAEQRSRVVEIGAPESGGKGGDVKSPPGEAAAPAAGAR